MAETLTADAVLKVLLVNPERYQLYVGDAGDGWVWAVTHSGEHGVGRVTARIVDELLTAKQIARVHSDHGHLYWAKDQTVDDKAWLALSREERRSGKYVYLPKPIRDLSSASAMRAVL